jgi:hypothetical protein
MKIVDGEIERDQWQLWHLLPVTGFLTDGHCDDVWCDGELLNLEA